MNTFNSFLKALSTPQKILSSINNINEGGCGIAALSMYRYLKKNNEIPPSFCFFLMDDEDDIIEDIKNDLTNNREISIVPNHIGIGILTDSKIKIFDCNGKISDKEYPYFTTCTNEKQIVDLLQKTSIWNRQFQRHKAIPFITERLKIDLSDIPVKAKELDYF